MGMSVQDDAPLVAAPPILEDKTMPALSDVMARVDLLLGRAVRAATEIFGAAPTADPFRGLYVSDADAARLVERGVEPLAQRLDFDRPLVDLETAGSEWRQLARTFALAPVELDVLALAIAPELDLRYERIFGYLHDDVTRRRPTVDLMLQLLCRSFEERLAARRLFSSEAPLVRFGIVQLLTDPAHPQSPSIDHAVRIDEGVIDFLLGQEGIDRRLDRAAHWDTIASTTPEAVDVASRVVRQLVETPDENTPHHVLLLGANERLKLDIARRAAMELEVPLLVIDLEQLARLETPFAESMLRAARAARLLSALPFWIRGDALGGGGEGEEAGRLDAWLSALAAMDVTGALLATPEPSAKWVSASSRRFITLEFPVPDSAQRHNLWSRALTSLGVTLSGDDATLLAEAFRFDGESIELAAERAAAAAHWRAPERPRVTRDDLFAGARAEATKALPRFATRLEAAYGWEDIVLPANQMQQLRELCDRVRHRRTVLDVWGFARRLPLAKGVAALFAGPSGTGKTMAAQVIASALGGLELYRVEIPAVVSKYIGETEKALDQVFREAKGTSAILFFDEADALFGKRSEVKDAHDRYANIEVSYLLQALEAYDGLAVLATNFRHNLDEAFVRRLSFIVNFPYPEEAERRAIWARGWPHVTPLGDDLDLDFLARQFKLTGGDIRNVALAAAFGAAANGGRVTMAHVIRGVGREYQKQGRVCAESEFGPYFELLA
jgi:winged helix domain-containing protein/ATPase family protein associated with various cellular activities (AAA)